MPWWLDCPIIRVIGNVDNELEAWAHADGGIREVAEVCEEEGNLRKDSWGRCYRMPSIHVVKSSVETGLVEEAVQRSILVQAYASNPERRIGEQSMGSQVKESTRIGWI